MHKTHPVMLVELLECIGTVLSVGEVFEPERVPVGVYRPNGELSDFSLQLWWKSRAIPGTRYRWREAFYNMDVIIPQELVFKCNGLSLSDQYWIKPEGSDLRWEDINFFQNDFSEDVGNYLFGRRTIDPNINLISPDATTDGWLQKKWNIIEGKRCLIKGSTRPYKQEPYNEILASEISRRLGIPHVPYTSMIIDEEPYSVCEDFITPKTELVSAWRIAITRDFDDDTSQYQHFLNCCEDLGIPDARVNLDKMLTLDYLIVNVDRHYGNFGAVRDVDTLEWLGLAPVFDSGTSLWYDRPYTMFDPYAKNPRKPFSDDGDELITATGSFDWLDLSKLQGIDEIFDDTPSTSTYMIKKRRTALCSLFFKRVEMLLNYIDGNKRILA
jgi:hypothetical protein